MYLRLYKFDLNGIDSETSRERIEPIAHIK